MIAPRAVSRATRRVVRRLTGARAGAIIVAAAIGLSGGLLSPVSAEAIGPTPCFLGFGCPAISIDTPQKPLNIDVPNTSLDIPKSSIDTSNRFHIQLGSTTIDQFKKKKPPKITPKVIIGTGVLAAEATCLIVCSPGSKNPPKKAGTGTEMRKPTTTTTTQTKSKTYAPGPGQRPRPQPRKVTPPGKPKPRAVPGRPATASNPLNAKSRRGGKARQQAARRTRTRQQQKGAAKHTARSRAVKKAKAERRLKRGQAIVTGVQAIGAVAGAAHAFGPGGTGQTGISDSVSPPPDRPLNKKGRRLEEQKKVLMPSQVHQMRGHNPTTNRNARIKQSHQANQVKRRLPPPPQKGGGRHPGKARH